MTNPTHTRAPSNAPAGDASHIRRGVSGKSADVVVIDERAEFEAAYVKRLNEGFRGPFDILVSPGKEPFDPDRRNVRRILNGGTAR